MFLTKQCMLKSVKNSTSYSAINLLEPNTVTASARKRSPATSGSEWWPGLDVLDPPRLAVVVMQYISLWKEHRASSTHCANGAQHGPFLTTPCIFSRISGKSERVNRSLTFIRHIGQSECHHVAYISDKMHILAIWGTTAMPITACDNECPYACRRHGKCYASCPCMWTGNTHPIYPF